LHRIGNGNISKIIAWFKKERQRRLTIGNKAIKSSLLITDKEVEISVKQCIKIAEFTRMISNKLLTCDNPATHTEYCIMAPIGKAGDKFQVQLMQVVKNESDEEVLIMHPTKYIYSPIHLMHGTLLVDNLKIESLQFSKLLLPYRYTHMKQVIAVCLLITIDTNSESTTTRNNIAYFISNYFTFSINNRSAII